MLVWLIDHSLVLHQEERIQAIQARMLDVFTHKSIYRSHVTSQWVCVAVPGQLVLALALRRHALIVQLLPTRKGIREV